MRTSNTSGALLALAAMLALPVAAGAAEITVWEHYDFSGASTVFNGANARLDDGWNDRISSFRVNSGSWEICRDWDYRNCQIVGPGTDGDMPRLSMGWNDSISSLRPVSAAASGANAETVAQRLYSGVLGRDADPEGLRNAAAKIRDGKLNELVAGLTQSDEFRNVAQQKGPTELLDQMYRGLLGRAADSAARTAYLPRLQRGDIANVVLDIVSSEEFDGGGAPAASSAASNVTQDEVRANGSGVVIWGGKKYFDTVTAARVELGSNGRIRISSSGSTPHSLEGSYTRESNDFIRVNNIEQPERGTVDVNGGVRLDHNQLARIDVTTGAQGTRDRVVFHFVADDYEPPREEALCQEEIEARLRSQGSAADKLAFLAPERSRVSSNRYRLSGEVVLLSANSTAQYRCEVDTRNNQLVDASVVANR